MTKENQTLSMISNYWDNENVVHKLIDGYLGGKLITLSPQEVDTIIHMRQSYLIVIHCEDQNTQQEMNDFLAANLPKRASN